MAKPPLILLAAALLLLILAEPATAAPTSQVRVVARYPHSTDSFTEGFFYRDGLFYEGTGQTGHSAVLAYEPTTGKVVRRYAVDPQVFGEGIVDWGDTLLEWTWQTHTGVVLNRATFTPLRTFTYQGEGWGMTRTDTQLITSDGTAILRFRSPYTFDPVRQIVVRDGATPIRDLNELEYIPTKNGGEIYANVWHSDRIARISPADGHVIAWIDCTGLLPPAQKLNLEAVLNGIAYDAPHDRLFVTGKQWPTIFEIKVLPPH